MICNQYKWFFPNFRAKSAVSGYPFTNLKFYRIWVLKRPAFEDLSAITLLPWYGQAFVFFVHLWVIDMQFSTMKMEGLVNFAYWILFIFLKGWLVPVKLPYRWHSLLWIHFFQHWAYLKAMYWLWFKVTFAVQ